MTYSEGSEGKVKIYAKIKESAENSKSIARFGIESKPEHKIKCRQRGYICGYRTETPTRVERDMSFSTRHTRPRTSKMMHTRGRVRGLAPCIPLLDCSYYSFALGNLPQTSVAAALVTALRRHSTAAIPVSPKNTLSVFASRAYRVGLFQGGLTHRFGDKAFTLGVPSPRLSLFASMALWPKDSAPVAQGRPILQTPTQFHHSLPPSDQALLCCALYRISH
jgi:hypothetical protein